jgi:hypothetical protein
MSMLIGCGMVRLYFIIGNIKESMLSMYKIAFYKRLQHINNMGLFSKSDKDKKETDPNEIMRDLEKTKKDKNRDYSYSFQIKSPYGDWGFL